MHVLCVDMHVFVMRSRKHGVEFMCVHAGMANVNQTATRPQWHKGEGTTVTTTVGLTHTRSVCVCNFSVKKICIIRVNSMFY